MARRGAIIVAALSIVGAIAVVAALIVRSPETARVRAVGTIAPTTTTPATAPTSMVTVDATYPTATTVPAPRRPTSIQIPLIGVDAPILAVGLESGTNNVEIPDIDHVGWYRLGPSPGQNGSAVLVGHVDGEGRPGIFWRLAQLAIGDRMTVTYDGAGPQTFRVTGRRQVAKAALPAGLFSRAGPPQLALITCGGEFNSATRHYADNVVIVATPVRA